MDQLAAMRAFTRIVETGSFSKASASLDLPRATVTKLIQSLEAHLRTSLLSRSTRRVAVTADGAAYYERATQLLTELDELDGSLAVSQLRPKGRLRIDIPPALAREVIVPALPGFFATYPDIQLDIGASDRPADMLAENVDCVIRGGTISDPSLIARRVGRLDMITCAAPLYLAEHGEPTHPNDLGNGHHRVGYFGAGSGRLFPFDFEHAGEHLEPAIPCRVTVNEMGSYVAAAAGGLGMAQMPIFLARPLLADGRLVRVLAGWQVPPVPLHIVYPPHRHLSNKLRVFVDWAATLFGTVR